MQALSARRGRRLIGACILEPVMQGAGGMIIPDPVFQRAMVRVCRQQGIPVIFDEVFSGLWRLGTASAAQQLGVQPDIACYAKLLTGADPRLKRSTRPHALMAMLWYLPKILQTLGQIPTAVLCCEALLTSCNRNAC